MNISYVLVNDDPPIYEFNGDLEKELLKVGVSLEHIEKMKSKIMQDTQLLYAQCNDIMSESKIMNVPVNKIVGVRRACSDISVFENIRRFNRKKSFSDFRMTNCLEYANKMTYDELRKSYSVLPEPVQLAHIIETDEYYVYGEHNHTTMCALIFDAPYIKADVRECHLNIEKVNNYKSMINFYNEYNIFKIEKEYFSSAIRIIFKDNDLLYCINYDRINENGRYNNIVTQIKEQLDTDRKALKIYNMLPFNCLKKFWYKFSLTDRQKLYIDKPEYSSSSKFGEFLLFTKI